MNFEPVRPSTITTSEMTSSPITTSTPEVTSSLITSSVITSSIITYASLEGIQSASNKSEESGDVVTISILYGILAFASIFLVALVIVAIRFLRKKRENKNEELRTRIERVNTESRDSVTEKDFFKNYIVSYDSLTFGSKIGEGTFGEVYL